jgi:hypothetical protein
MAKTLQRTPHIRCPIELETLLADIQGELSLDEARLVHLHIRGCEQCQARATQLSEIYERVASLADVPEVPTADIRDAVLRDSQGRLRAARMARSLNLGGRGLLLAIAGAVSALIILIVLVANPFLREHFLSTSRSQNALTKLAPVGTGIFYAETVKLIPVSYHSVSWDLGEIIAVDEQNGRVVQSLPASSSAPFLPELGIGSGSNVHPALSGDGQTIIEAAIAADGRSPTAFANINAITGQVRYIQKLQVPGGADAQSDPVIHQMWISPDGKTLFVLTDLAVQGQRSARLLQFTLSTGQQLAAVIPTLDDTQPATILSSASVLVPANSMLYAATPATDAKGNPGISIAFISLPDGKVMSTLFVPGDNRLYGMELGSQSNQLYLFNGHTFTVTFIATDSRTVTSSLVLGKPGAPPAGAAPDQGADVTLALTPDGQSLYIALDAPNDTPRNFELWGISVTQQSILSVTQLPQPIGPIVATSNGAAIILLRDNGKLESITTNSPQLPIPWVTLQGSTPITQEIGAAALPTK